MRRLSLCLAAGLLACTQAQAFDLGSALKGATDIANAANGNQQNNQTSQYEAYQAEQAARAEAYQREADCRAKLADNQDKVALLQVAGALSGDQATQAQLENPEALCARLAEQQASGGNGQKSDALNIGNQLLNGLGR